MVEALTIVLAMGVTRGWRPALIGAGAATLALAAIVAALITLVDGASPDEARPQIERFVEGVNAELSRFEQIKRYAILPRDFSAEEGEVTPTLKLKRRVCHEHFAAEIEGLYS